jgi:poly-gamma-glutamate synthesis protein (capsule biosynthesis protein)
VTVLALLGDVMLGRRVAEAIDARGPASLFADELVEVLGEADAVIANLECCISDRGERWPDPHKPFFFRAPPAAVDALHGLGVTAVTLANNHALDYGEEALLDTVARLHDAGIATTGAGADVDAARRPARLVVGDATLRLVGCTDHPREYAATPSRPGVAYAELAGSVDRWLEVLLAQASGTVTVMAPHWGPNMVGEPINRVRAVAAALRRAGAMLVAGHSAHVFHGVADRVLFDLGDFIDDYATHPELRNDLGLAFLVELRAGVPVRVSGVPIALDFCHTRLAEPGEAAWIRDRFVAACAALGTHALVDGDRIVVELTG